MGLYYYDTRGPLQKSHRKDKVKPVIMVNTVRGSMQGFTDREIRGANEARRLFRIVWRLSQQKFRNMIKYNLLHNCPVTLQDVDNAVLIYGKEINYVKGKTVRKTPSRVPIQTP